ncbi:MAG: XisI protein [Armatimonadetes bacterium]|nr:XisI protein [Armatimonadota bacterium]
MHRVWLHIELHGGKFWIHEDNTEIGIANCLVAAGVPKERIVLAFHKPILRTESGFAAG